MTTPRRTPYSPMRSRVVHRPVRRPHVGVRIAHTAPDRHGTRATVTVYRRSGASTAYTMGEIARAALLNTSTVTRVFSGLRGGQLQTIERIADVLGVSLDLLLAHLRAHRRFTPKSR